MKQPHYGCETCAHFGRRGRRLCQLEIPQQILTMRIEPVTSPCPSYVRKHQDNTAPAGGGEE